MTESSVDVMKSDQLVSALSERRDPGYSDPAVDALSALARYTDAAERLDVKPVRLTSASGGIQGRARLGVAIGVALAFSSSGIAAAVTGDPLAPLTFVVKHLKGIGHHAGVEDSWNLGTAVMHPDVSRDNREPADESHSARAHRFDGPGISLSSRAVDDETKKAQPADVRPNRSDHARLKVAPDAARPHSGSDPAKASSDGLRPVEPRPQRATQSISQQPTPERIPEPVVPEPVPAGRPETTLEPVVPEPVPEGRPETTLEPVPEPGPEGRPETTLEPGPEPGPEGRPETTLEPGPEGRPETTLEPGPETTPETTPETRSNPTPQEPAHQTPTHQEKPPHPAKRVHPVRPPKSEGPREPEGPPESSEPPKSVQADASQHPGGQPVSDEPNGADKPVHPEESSEDSRPPAVR